MIAADYPLLNVFFSILFFFLFIMWFWIAITVMIDIFRSNDMSGLTKAIWVLAIVILPYLGVFIYLISRGGSMADRQVKEAKASEAAFQEYIRDAAGTSSPADQLTKLADLHDRGHLTAEEYAAQKARILNS